MAQQPAIPATLPPTQLGVLTSQSSHTLQSFPVPAPGPGEVLIKNVTAASNPKDWKVPQWLGPDYKTIEGNDVAGYIVRVGEGVTEYKGGERVAAFTKGTTGDPKYGAYAEYSVAPASTTFPIPETISFEEAATIPITVATAFIGLFKRLGLPEPPADPDAPIPSRNEAVIVYGASSSVGAYALQLAKRAGFYVVGVAGKSTDYVTTLGADAVVDYRAHTGEGALVSAILAALGKHPSAHAYDAISLPGTTLTLAQVLAKSAPGGKGKVTYLLSVNDEEAAQVPPGIEIVYTMVGTAYAEDEEFAARFYRQISRYLVPSAGNTRPFQPNRVRVLPNGLASVEEGLRQLKANEVHAEKLVYRIAETPGLKA